MIGKILVTAGAGLILAACAAGNGMVPGNNEGVCDERPEECASATAVHDMTDGNATPRPTDAALRKGEAGRIWFAALRYPNGVLTKSGWVFVD